MEVKLQVVCHHFPDDSDELAGTGETVNITYFTDLSILFEETPHKLLVLGIQNNAVSEMLNESLNKNKELLNLFSQLAKMRFSWRV